MDLSPNRRNYIREQLQSSLSIIGIPIKEHPDLIEACFVAIKSIGESQLYGSLDIGKRIDDIARAAKQSKVLTKEKIIAQPFLLLGVKPKETGPAKTPPHSAEVEKTIPSDQEIVHAAIKNRFFTGHFPTKGSKNSQLPETSAAWHKIISELVKRKTTILKLVKDFYPDASHEFKAGKKKRKLSTLKLMPSDLMIAEAGLKYFNTNGRMPNTWSKKAELPEFSILWPAIIKNLQGRKTTVSEIVKEFYPDTFRKAEKTAKERKKHDGKIMPSDQEIAEAAVKIKTATGRLPDMGSKASGLPENSYSWATIIPTLRKRGTTISRVVKKFYPDTLQNTTKAKERKPRIVKTMPSDQIIAEKALKIKTATGRFPDMGSKKHELPEDSYPWSAILPSLTKRGTTISRVVREFYPDEFKNAKKPVKERIGRAPKNIKTPVNFIPDHEAIADAAIAVKGETGYLPNLKSRKLGLPKGSAEWATIIQSLQQKGFTLVAVIGKYYKNFLNEVEKPAPAFTTKGKLSTAFVAPSRKKPVWAAPVSTERDTSAVKVAAKTAPAEASPLSATFTEKMAAPLAGPAMPEPESPAPARLERLQTKTTPQSLAFPNKFMPPLEVIAQAGWEYQKAKGKKPDMNSKSEFLPEGSHSWPALILAHLKGENVLRKLMERFPDKDAKQAPCRHSAEYNARASAANMNRRSHPDKPSTPACKL